MNEPSNGIALRPVRSLVPTSAGERRAPALALDAPAIELMTDLDRTPMVAVEADMQIDDALRLMKCAGVRSAIVVDERGAPLGLATAYDILGEKPVRLVESAGRAQRPLGRAGVTVASIMEPVAQWQAIDVHDLQRCRVADAVETFRRTGRTHIPVVERTAGGEDRLRGLLSAAEVARRTGADTSGLRHAAIFAEIGQAMPEGVLP